MAAYIYFVHLIGFLVPGTKGHVKQMPDVSVSWIR